MASKKVNKKDPLKSKTEWSITEFQMWLHGAYSLQGEEWVPTAEQWEMIVDIIYKLKDRPAVKRVIAAQSPVLMPQGGYGGGEMVSAPSALGPPVIGGDGVNPPFDPEASVPAEAGMSIAQLNQAANAGKIGQGQKSIKTANIDTSKGYNSSFD